MELRDKIQEALENSQSKHELIMRIRPLVVDETVHVKQSELRAIAHARLEKTDADVDHLLCRFLDKYLDDFEYRVLK